MGSYMNTLFSAKVRTIWVISLEIYVGFDVSRALLEIADVIYFHAPTRILAVYKSELESGDICAGI